MDIIDLIPSDISFNRSSNLQAIDSKYTYDLSFSSDNGLNIGAHAFTADGYWQSGKTIDRPAKERYQMFNPPGAPAGTTYPTYDTSSNPIHENGEFVEIAFSDLEGNPREYFLTQAELSFFDDEGEMRVGHIMGGRVQDDGSTKYTMLKMMGDYSVLVDNSGTYIDISKNQQVTTGTLTAYADPSGVIRKISSNYNKPYYYYYTDGYSNMYVKHKTSLQNDVTVYTVNTADPLNGFAYNIYDVSGVYGIDYEFYKTFNDAKSGTNTMSKYEGMLQWGYIKQNNWIRKLMILYQHMNDNIQYGAVVKHIYNLNPIDPYSKFRFVFEQLKTKNSIKVKQIKLKGTRQAYNINAFDAHLEHFTNYNSFQENKRSVSFDENRNTIVHFDDLEQSHQYSIFLIPSVLVFISTFLILKNKI
jgi:hypothetical protein